MHSRPGSGTSLNLVGCGTTLLSSKLDGSVVNSSLAWRNLAGPGALAAWLGFGGQRPLTGLRAEPFCQRQNDFFFPNPFCGRFYPKICSISSKGVGLG